MRAWLLSLLLLLVLTPARGALAHDPFESTTAVRVRAASLELDVTLTHAAAVRLAEARGGTPDDFAALGPHLYAVTVNGRPLVLRASSARPGEENELTVSALYDAPEPGTLG